MLDLSQSTTGRSIGWRGPNCGVAAAASPPKRRAARGEKRSRNLCVPKGRRLKDGDGKGRLPTTNHRPFSYRTRLLHATTCPRTTPGHWATFAPRPYSLLDESLTLRAPHWPQAGRSGQHASGRSSLPGRCVTVSFQPICTLWRCSTALQHCHCPGALSSPRVHAECPEGP